MAYDPRYHKRRSIRLRGYDYRQKGSYFITIGTYKGICYFGKLKEGLMHPSRIGELAEARWLAIPAHHPHILLDAFVVMPNHLHGILHIIAPPSSSVSPGRLTYARVFGPPDAGSISTVMRSYKASVTRECRKQGLLFRWHTRFYDRIIRNENALENVRNYIHRNPIKWHFKYNTPND